MYKLGINDDYKELGFVSREILYDGGEQLKRFLNFHPNFKFP